MSHTQASRMQALAINSKELMVRQPALACPHICIIMRVDFELELCEVRSALSLLIAATSANPANQINTF